MKSSILVTGASGVLGRATTEAFRSAGLSPRQAVRDPAKAKPGVDAVRFDYTDPATFGPALEGVEGVLLMAPSLDPAAPQKLDPVIALAKERGVRQIVLISAFGVNHNEQAPLRVVEHALIGSGVPYTILRPNFFMENFSEGFLAGGIRRQCAIDLAAGDGKTSFISVRDVADAAIAAFRQRLTGRELDLTGPEALDHAEVAQIISDSAGRPVAYHALTEEQMLAGARSAGMPEPQLGFLAALYAVVRAGYAAAVTPDFEQVAGRAPAGFREFARTAAAGAWR